MSMFSVWLRLNYSTTKEICQGKWTLLCLKHYKVGIHIAWEAKGKWLKNVPWGNIHFPFFGFGFCLASYSNCYPSGSFAKRLYSLFLAAVCPNNNPNNQHTESHYRPLQTARLKRPDSPVRWWPSLLTFALSFLCALNALVGLGWARECPQHPHIHQLQGACSLYYQCMHVKLSLCNQESQINCLSSHAERTLPMHLYAHVCAYNRWQ